MKLVVLLVVVCVLLAVFGDGQKSHKCKKCKKSKKPKSGNMSKGSTAKECQRLKTPGNGQIITTATVVCDSGYIVQDNDQITCEEDGKWSNGLGICVVDPCAVEPCENGGTCVLNGTDYSCECPELTSGINCSTVTLFKCDFNLDLCGILDLTMDLANAYRYDDYGGVMFFCKIATPVLDFTGTVCTHILLGTTPNTQIRIYPESDNAAGQTSDILSQTQLVSLQLELSGTNRVVLDIIPVTLDNRLDVFIYTIEIKTGPCPAN